MQYGYVRVSTPHQRIARQITNIKELYPSVTFVKEFYTGTTQNRPLWDKLIKQLEKGDTVIFDSVSRMSRNAEEGFKDYKALYEMGVNLIFLNEPLINTSELKRILNDTFEKALVAFLNSRDGVIYIGVEDNGERSAEGCYIRMGTSCRSMTEEEIENGYRKSIAIESAPITDIRSHRQNYTFNILKQSLTGKGYHINDETLLNNPDLLTQSGEYNTLAELLADENNVSIKVAVFKGKDKTVFQTQRVRLYKSYRRNAKGD